MTGIEFTERVEAIPVYPAARTYDYEGELTKLASNETPYPPHPAVLEAIQEATAILNRYPDPSAGLLRRRIADRHGVPQAKVAVGNGSCEILLAAAQAMLEPGAEIVHAWPSFSMYPHLAAMTGARAITVPLDSQGRHDLDAIADEITVATRIVIVNNPNNPTATALAVDEIDAFVARVPDHVLVIVDEAYVEFSMLGDPDESLALLKRHNNVVLLRTFSKVYGLCGLRAGYSLGPEPFRLAVDRVRQPFSVNALAQAAAAEALRHLDEVERRVERTVIERLHVQDALAERGLSTTDSQANFSWVALADELDEDERAAREEAVYAGLARRGVIVREGSALGEPGHLRVTYGTRSENDRFLAALDAALAHAR
ncbi:MAG TPA: histidinol-phosphate transaminase [Thermoleophilaceae bacterium]|nr:histidinol-phosphate transaminase [Thermoleophilaceae bacterium]